MDILQASNSNFTVLSQYISDPIIWLSPNLSILHLNHNACKLYQWNLDVVGQHYLKLCKKEGKDALMKPKWLGVLSEKGYIHDTLTLKLASNNPEKLTFTVCLTHLLNTQGELIGYMLIAKDISLETRLKNIVNIDETYLEDIIENMPGLVYWKNKNSQYMGCNKNVAIFSGLKSRADVVGKRDEDFGWGHDMAESFRADDKEVMRTGKLKITVHKLPIMDKLGQPIYVRTEKRPLTDKYGEVIGVLGVALDVTNELEIEKLNKEKQIAQKTITRLKAVAGSIAHQIIDPLASVKISYGFIHGVMYKLLDNYRKAVKIGCIKPNIADEEILKAQQFGSRIEPLIHQTGYVINHHLTNIRENSWHTVIDWTLLEPQSMASIVEKAIADYPLMGEQKRLISLNTAHDFKVLGEVRLLVHAVTNLLSNAFASIELAGKGNVSIWLERGRIFNYLNIKDTGAGLPREGRGDIFKPFNTNGQSGTGLGLYFCQSVMKGYHGDIICKGEKGHNANAQFTLKFLHPHEAQKKFRKNVKIH